MRICAKTVGLFVLGDLGTAAIDTLIANLDFDTFEKSQSHSVQVNSLMQIGMTTAVRLSSRQPIFGPSELPLNNRPQLPEFIGRAWWTRVSFYSAHERVKRHNRAVEVGLRRLP
jgi:hypothetical protein